MQVTFWELALESQHNQSNCRAVNVWYMYNVHPYATALIVQCIAGSSGVITAFLRRKVCDTDLFPTSYLAHLVHLQRSHCALPGVHKLSSKRVLLKYSHQLALGGRGKESHAQAHVRSEDKWSGLTVLLFFMASAISLKFSASLSAYMQCLKHRIKSIMKSQLPPPPPPQLPPLVPTSHNLP